MNFPMGMLNSILRGRGKTSLLVRRWLHSGHANLVVSVMIRNIEIIRSSQGRTSRLDSYRPRPGSSPNSNLATISSGMDISMPICEPRAEYATPCAACPEISMR